MSTRTDWGYFDKDGKPVAVGDEWHKWICPQRKYVLVGYKHTYTDEWINEGFQLEDRCPMTTVSAKRETCAKCGMVFIYP